MDTAGEEVLEVLAYRAGVGERPGAAQLDDGRCEQGFPAAPVPVEGGLGDAGAVHDALDAEA